MIDISLIITFFVLLIATYTDIKRREVPDWLSFSFIAIASIIALTKSIIAENFSFLLNSLFGFIVFFVLAELFYHGKLFAGGDAKLLMGIGTALGADIHFVMNVLFLGGIYGLIYSFVLAAINFEKVKTELKKTKIPILLFVTLSLISLILGIFLNSFFYFIAILSLISPLLYAFTFAVEKVSLIKTVSPKKLTEGDWLAKDVKIKGKIIKATYEGLSKSDIHEIKKANLNVKIKYGLPFVPVFLIAFIAKLIFGNVLMQLF
ncbi:MAG: A24 family peptidase [Candidatus Pacearchaeota archaeon]